MKAPLIETDRLILRGLEESDFEAFAHMHEDAEAMRFLGGSPLARHEAWRTLAFFLGHWQLRGYGMWAVVDRTSNQLVGRLGFHQPIDWPGFEIGWLTARTFWGRGYATEGAAAVLPLAKSLYGQPHVISLIHPDNAASIRVAEKLGETLEGETDLRGTRVLIYGIRMDETES